MNKKVLVAGATDSLEGRVLGELIKRWATVGAIVRASTDPEKTSALRQIGVEVQEVDLNSVEAIASARAGAKCVVSALAGLSDVIVDLQRRILHGTLQAGVPRFIPSDFCTDYNDLVPGENRNFDLRREFKE